MQNEYYSNKKLLKKIILSLTYLIISIVLVILITSIRNMDFNSWSKYFSLLIIVQFIFQYLFLKLMNFKMFSLAGIFLILSYLFHFGQLLIMVFFPNYEFARFNYYLFYDSYGLKIASEFALVVILMVGFGILISIKRDSEALNLAVKKNLSQCKKTGWIIVLLTFPIQLYLDITKLHISVQEGYLATYYTGRAGIWGTIGFISFIGFALLILGYSEDKKKSLSIFVFLMVYLIITMFSGHRGHQITIMLLYIYIIQKVVHRIKVKNLIFISGMGFIGLAILDSIATFRNISEKTLWVFWMLLVNNLRGDPIKNMIVELGGTINTVYLAIQQVPEYISHTYGATYLTSVFSIMPNIGGVFSNINTYAIYQKSLYGSSLGGSYIGELYYNFSYFGVFFAIFIGIFVTHISQRMEELINKRDYFNLAYYVPLFTYILWWPRDAFASMLRPFVWGAIVLFIVNGISKIGCKKAVYGIQSNQKNNLISKDILN